MRQVSEPLNIDQSTFALINRSSAEIAPERPDLAEWYAEYRNLHAERFSFDLDLVTKHVGKERKIVDLASAPFILLRALASEGYDVEGVDIAPERFSGTLDSLHLTVRKCDIEREPLPYEDGAVDVVVFNEIFEHLRIDLIHTVREINRILARDGLLLLSTPNGLSLRHLRRLLVDHRIGPDIYREYSKLSQLGHMGHVREYSYLEVADFLAQIGFRIEEVLFRGRYESRLLDGICSMLPKYRPYYSLIARKSDSAAN